jgi:hypothetical protein
MQRHDDGRMALQAYLAPLGNEVFIGVAFFDTPVVELCAVTPR